MINCEKILAYGTYAEKGVLYTKDGYKINDKDKYYATCGGKITKTEKNTYTSKGTTYEYVKGTGYKRYWKDK